MGISSLLTRDFSSVMLPTLVMTCPLCKADDSKQKMGSAYCLHPKMQLFREWL
jgi:hypothetical protein